MRDVQGPGGLDRAHRPRPAHDPHAAGLAVFTGVVEAVAALDHRQVRSAALQALSHRERTTGELVAWLAEREVSSEEIEDVCDRLAAAQVLADAIFARRFAEDKRDLPGWGPVRPRQALAHRGGDRA